MAATTEILQRDYEIYQEEVQTRSPYSRTM